MKNRDLLKRIISISLIASMGFSTGIVAFAGKESEESSPPAVSAGQPAKDSRAPEFPMGAGIIEWALYKAGGLALAGPWALVSQLPRTIAETNWLWKDYIKPFGADQIISRWNEYFQGFRKPEDIDAELERQFAQISGLEETKDQIRGFVDEFKAYIADIARGKITQPRGHILVLAGRSGTGKSTLAKAMLNAIYKTPDSYLHLERCAGLNGSRPLGGNLKSMLLERSGGERYSSYGSGYQGSNHVDQTSSVADFIASHKKAAGVLLDDYDKMCDNGEVEEIDGKIVKKVDTSFDDVLATFHSEGRFIFDQHSSASCPCGLVVITTNESMGSLCNDIDDSERESTQAADSDGTIHTLRDPSFLNRLRVIHVDKPATEDFRKIMLTSLEKAKESLEHNYGFKVQIDKSAIDTLVKFSDTALGGMHTIQTQKLEKISGLGASMKRAFQRAGIDISKKTFVLCGNQNGNLKLKYSPADSLTQVIFKKPADWKNLPHVYFYKTLEDGTEEASFEWPGLPMYSENGDDIYQYKLPAEFCAQGVKVMFSDGADGAQIPAADEPGFPLDADETGTFDGEGWKTEFTIHGDPIPEASPKPSIFGRVTSAVGGLFSGAQEVKALPAPGVAGSTAAVSSAAKEITTSLQMNVSQVRELFRRLKIGVLSKADAELILQIFNDAGISSSKHEDLKHMMDTLKQFKKCDKAEDAIQRIKSLKDGRARNIHPRCLQFIFDTVKQAMADANPRPGDSCLDKRDYLV